MQKLADFSNYWSKIAYVGLQKLADFSNYWSKIAYVGGQAELIPKKKFGFKANRQRSKAAPKDATDSSSSGENAAASIKSAAVHTNSEAMDDKLKKLQLDTGIR